MLCTRCTLTATALYKAFPMCRGHWVEAIVEEATAILDRRLQTWRNAERLQMRQGDPAGTWSFEAPPTYTVEGGP